MAPNFFSGYLAQGTGGQYGFVENTATGYSRKAVTLSPLAGGSVSHSAPVQYAAQVATTVTQRALYDASSGGNLIMWWNLANPITIPANGFDNIKSGAVSYAFPAHYNGMGTGSAEVDFTNGSAIGVTNDGLPIYAGHFLSVVNGTVAAKSSV